MRKIVLLFFLLCSAGGALAQDGHQIIVQLKHLKSGQVYLGNYYGKDTYLTDTAQISTDGTAVFKGAQTLPGGIYFILYPSQKMYFEFLVGKQQHFTILADSTHHFDSLQIRHSPVNQQFQKYNRWIAHQHRKIMSAKKNGLDSAAFATVERQVEDTIRGYRKKVIEQHPHTVLATLFSGMTKPELPENLKENQEQAFKYRQRHFWDHIDFSDSSMVRSPILETRLNRYFNQMLPMVPDSIDKAADEVLTRAAVNKENFKFVLWWLTSNYERSEYMGMDAVFVHLVEKYYATGKAYWLKREQLQRIVGKAAKIAPNLIGNIAPTLKLKTVDLKSRRLSDVQAPYTILVFWDPTCGHCKVIVPKLDSAYQRRWKKMGVKVVGVRTGGTKDQWQDFIQKHHLEDWINLWDPENRSDYRRLYNVYQTPIIYLLGKHKKILAKHLSVDQLAKFLQHETSKSTSS